MFAALVCYILISLLEIRLELPEGKDVEEDQVELLAMHRNA